MYIVVTIIIFLLVVTYRDAVKKDDYRLFLYLFVILCAAAVSGAFSFN